MTVAAGPRRHIQATHCAVAVLMFLATLSACGNADRGSFSVLIPWTEGSEAKDFDQVVANFEKTPEGRGITVQKIQTRATRQALEAAVHDHRPPNLAIVPTPGVLRDYVQQHQVTNLDDILGKRKLRELREEYGPTWLGFDRVGTGNLYAVVVKANVKSLVWYNRTNFPYQAPTTWSQLDGVARRIISTRTGTDTAPWCMAMSDPPSSGWPGTDWIEDILLHQSGWSIYARFADGKWPWNSDEVKNAWRAWAAMIAAPGRLYGGRLSTMLTPYGTGDSPMFTHPAGCHLSHGARVDGTIVDSTVPSSGKPAAGKAGATPTTRPPVADKDTDFFDFPSFNATAGQAYEVSADFMAMFKPSPQATAFLDYLTGSEAQEVWPKAEKDQAFTPNRTDLRTQLKGNVKGATVGERINRILASGRPLCFDASDWMPDVMANAFYRATFAYLNDPTESRLDKLSKELDEVRGAIPANLAPTTTGTACGPATTT